MTNIESGGELPIWTIYQRPKEFPDGYVARKWVVEASSELKLTVEVIPARRLSDLRDALAGMGLTRLDRMPEDDPSIVEVWI